MLPTSAFIKLIVGRIGGSLIEVLNAFRGGQSTAAGQAFVVRTLKLVTATNMPNHLVLKNGKKADYKSASLVTATRHWCAAKHTCAPMQTADECDLAGRVASLASAVWHNVRSTHHN
jgi:hypothetical protein